MADNEQQQPVTEAQINSAEAIEKVALANWVGAKAKLQELNSMGQRTIEQTAAVKELEAAYREKANAAARLRIDHRTQTQQAIEKAASDKVLAEGAARREETLKNNARMNFIRAGLGSLSEFEERWGELRKQIEAQAMQQTAQASQPKPLVSARNRF